jgi:hypothetical protein
LPIATGFIRPLPARPTAAGRYARLVGIVKLPDGVDGGCVKAEDRHDDCRACAGFHEMIDDEEAA